MASLKILADSSEDNVEVLLIHAVEDASEDVWIAAKDVLIYRHPWLLLRPFESRQVPQKVLNTPWGKSWQSLRLGIQSLLKKNNAPDIKILKRFISLPGIIPDLVEELESAGAKDFALKLIYQANLYDTTKEENQLLFVPTYDCNLSCGYCYAKGFNSLFNTDVSIDDMNTMFSWAERQDINLIVLAGGEPTIYNNFSQFLTMAYRKGIKIHLTTNGLYSESVKKLIKPEYIKTLIVHYDQSLLRNRTLHKRFQNNLSTAKSNGMDLRFRYTLTAKSNQKEWGHILDTVTLYDIDTLDYACAFKNYFGNNDDLQEVYQKKGAVFEETFLSFVKDCFSKSVKLHLCKPIPLCSFSDETLRYFMVKGVLRSACGAYYRDFTNNLTINPDLSTFPCNAIPLLGPSIKSLRTLKDAGNFYSEKINQILFSPYCSKCNNCLFFFRGFCQGTCLAEKYSKINSKGDMNVLPSKAPAE